MKKILTCSLLALFIACGAVFLAACGSSTLWLLPEFTVSTQGYTVEHVTNEEKDFEYPIEGKKLSHSNYENGTIEYGWVIYGSNREIAGWIEASSGYESDNKGNFKYGYSTSVINGETRFANAEITVVLKGEDLTVFEGVEVSSNHGTATKSDAFSATEKYSYYDEAENVTKPLGGAENFVCCNFFIALSDISPETITELKIQIKL